MIHDRRLSVVLAAGAVLALLAVFSWHGSSRAPALSGARVSVALALPAGLALEYSEIAQLEQIAASAPELEPLSLKPVKAPSVRVAAAPGVASVTIATDPHAGMVRKVIVSKGRRTVTYVPASKPNVPSASGETPPVPRAVRFDMNQNGKRMTADEFDAWMKAQGIRVATGAAKPVPVPVPVAAEPACKPDKDVSC